jgi:hypothetical protein
MFCLLICLHQLRWDSAASATHESWDFSAESMNYKPSFNLTHNQFVARPAEARHDTCPVSTACNLHMIVPQAKEWFCRFDHCECEKVSTQFNGAPPY